MLLQGQLTKNLSLSIRPFQCLRIRLSLQHLVPGMGTRQQRVGALLLGQECWAGKAVFVLVTLHCQWWGELQKHLVAHVIQAFDF